MPTNKSISELTAIDAAAAGDLFPVVDVSESPDVTKKATLTQILASTEKTANKDQANGYPGLDADGKITLAKIVSSSGASKILGRGSSSGAGAFQELTLGTGLDLTGTVLSATATGGGAAWTLVSEVTASAAGHNQFSLGSYAEVMITGHALTNSSGPAVIQCLVSINGSTFLSSSGDYISIGTDGVGANDTSLSSSNNSSSTRYFCRLITFFNTVKPKWSHNFIAAGANATYVIPTTSALVGVRVQVHTGSFSGGTIRFYGRS